MLEFNLGYSHDIHFMLPKEVKATVEIARKGANSGPDTYKSRQTAAWNGIAAKIRSLRVPEPYKGKGIKFVDEQIRRKAGKSAGAK